MKPLLCVVLPVCVCLFGVGVVMAAGDANAVKWYPFPDSHFQVRGLPWFKENAPDLWRLSKTAKRKVPERVWERAVAPDGGRICFSSSSSRLALRVKRQRDEKKHCFFDVFVNGKLAGSAEVTGRETQEIVLFENKGQNLKEITVYLPNNHEVSLAAIGLDAAAKVEKIDKPALPIVCYGSSVLQGTGAAHPSETYPAIAARRLSRDFVNLGFGGAGKAEPEVVALIKEIDACCYILDLGKSYGDQGIKPYAEMLRSIRTTHLTTPIICVTPIYSTKEATEPGYKEKSEKLRALMRTAVNELQSAGDKNMFVVEGMDLFGPADKDLFSDPLHPGDQGNERIAERLAQIAKRILSKN